VAAALDWCRSDGGQQILDATTCGNSERVGILVVITGGADVWEISQVPLRIEANRYTRLLCPVHDRTQLLAETDVVGIAHLISRLEVDPTKAWMSLLKILRDEAPLPTIPPSPKVADEIKMMISSNYREQTEYLSSGTSFETIRKLREFLHKNPINRKVQAVVLAGPWSSIEELPDFLSEFVRELGVQVVSQGVGSPLDGTLEGMRRHTNRFPPYYEALAPYQILYWGRNAYRDPVRKWLNLLEETEVPVGKDYESPEPIKELSIAADRNPMIDLILKSKRLGETKHLAIREPLRSELNQESPVLITARIQPGRGLARVKVRSVEAGIFDTKIRADRAKELSAPPQPEYGWPPGSAWLVSHESMALAAIEPLQDVVDFLQLEDEDSLQSALGIARAAINKWLLPSEAETPVSMSHLDYPRDEIHPMFVYLSVFPNASIEAHPTVESILQDLEVYLPFALSIDVGAKTRKKSLWFASWLYARCPKCVLDYVREELRKPWGGDGEILACAGNCFHQDYDYALFFRRIAHFVENERVNPQNWIRAYRNLARFRHDALSLDVLSKETQERLLKAYLRTFEEAWPSSSGNSVFLHCCYLAPHILKRRRYDPLFLEPGDPLAERYADVLRWAHESALTPKHRINVQCALEFLNKQADVRTLERLGRIQG